MVRIRQLGQPGDLGWIVQAHGERYATEFGWDTSFEALVARIVADYADNVRPDRDAGWIAELDDRRVGCVLCVYNDDETAQLRLLLVDPVARGHGLGRRLVDRCLEFASAAGYRKVTLWTNHPLVAARAIYLAAGFALVGQDDGAQPRFGANLIGQSYELDLSERHKASSTA